MHDELCWSQTIKWPLTHNEFSSSQTFPDHSQNFHDVNVISKMKFNFHVVAFKLISGQVIKVNLATATVRRSTRQFKDSSSIFYFGYQQTSFMISALGIGMEPECNLVKRNVKMSSSF